MNPLDETTLLTRFSDSIRAITELSEQNKEWLFSTLTMMEIPRGGFLLKAGTVCDAVFYIGTGYCKSCYDLDGKTVNTQFHLEGAFVTNIASYSKKEPSDYSIRACESMIVAKIEKTAFIEEVYKRSPELEHFGRKMLEWMIVQQEEHLNLFKLYTPQQRYIYLERHRPEIIRRVPVAQLASYLGVTRETLTRIRKKNLTGI